MAKRVLGLLLGLVVALALLATGATAVSCRTNGASPTQGDANSCVQFIRNLGSSDCGQQNCGSDRCTVMCRAGGAQVKICGDCNKGTRCSNAGDALNNVLAQCVVNVGGTARVAGSDDRDGFTFVIEGTPRTLSKYDVNCMTNGDAPSQRDADRVVQHLRKHGEEKCKQTTCHRDQCTVLHRDGDAQAKICGGKCNDGPKCTVAGNALNEVLAQCVANVGGKALVAGESEADGYRFVLEKAGRMGTSREPRCTTNGDSPMKHDAKKAVDHLKSRGNDMYRPENCRSDKSLKCSNMYETGTALVEICGDCDRSIKYSTVADAVNEVMNRCERGDRVSGFIEADGFEIGLVRSNVGSHVTCTTDNHGVRLDEANDVIEHLRSLGNSECKQNNCNGDKCTTVYQRGNARVRLCGNCNKSIKCAQAGDALLEMVPKCTKCDNGMPVVSGKTEVEGFTVELEGARKNILMMGE